MPCFHPLTMYHGRNGGMTSNRHASKTGIPKQLPCGQCIGCRLEKSRQWAMRISHEKLFHDNSVFVTLTYDNTSLPLGGTLVKRDLQLFHKRLRKKFRARYFAVGEYGDVSLRPHYHTILFGVDFPDKQLYRRDDVDVSKSLFTSDTLSALWPHGMAIFGAVTFESAAYVARYCTKKVTGSAADAHYEVVDQYGEVFRRCAEFAVMSLKPAIGQAYYDKYHPEIYAHDSVILREQEMRPPRFYDKKFAELFPERFEALQRKRLKNARPYRSDNTPDRRRVKEVIALRRFHDLQRKI